MTTTQIEGARAAAAAPPPRLAVSRLSKTFGSARVLTDIHFDVRPGEIHALVGQNGSGKSTAAKILSGLYTPDEGCVVSIDGSPFELPVRPDEAQRRGMAVVHQNLGLLPSFSVLENMRIGRLKGQGILKRIDWKREREAAEAVFERIGRAVPLDAPVASLHEEERATVGIARALQDAQPGQGLIIFDESTRALSRRALEHFFVLLDEIVSTGTAVLMITHRLEEVLDAADRVTVLRDGRSVASGHDVAGMSEADLTSIMLGRDLERGGGRAAFATDAAASVQIAGLTGGVVEEIDIDVRPGEVVGVTGIAGSGYEEVPYLLGGAQKAKGGTVRVGGAELAVRGLTPGGAAGAGIVLLPEGREKAGLAMTMSVSENIAFPHTVRRAAALLPNGRRPERTRTAEWIDRLDVRPPRAEAAVGTFSGGNQQKVLLAKCLSTAPELLLLHEPTQAVDVGARRTIVDAIHDAAAQGAHVLVAGSDENELSMLCDRVLVFEGGKVARELRAPISPDDIVAAIYTGGTRARLRSRTESVETPEERE
ncbi:sugar ABC transporter ATP-binding protein [Microbacterium sp. NPDC096154]|uniref:sugar ABC transporter ATP-binding protein n=1 Tax=Microbacterium sp. NPDC096154 TaxID=3155549 RepID=UPI0033291449